MTENENSRPFLVRGQEHGQIVEFTTATRETAERLVSQLREQGLEALIILEASGA